MPSLIILKVGAWQYVALIVSLRRVNSLVGPGTRSAPRNLEILEKKIRVCIYTSNNARGYSAKNTCRLFEILGEHD
jgi:hypothetical protein